MGSERSVIFELRLGRGLGYIDADRSNLPLYLQGTQRGLQSLCYEGLRTFDFSIYKHSQSFIFQLTINISSVENEFFKQDRRRAFSRAGFRDTAASSRAVPAELPPPGGGGEEECDPKLKRAVQRREDKNKLHSVVRYIHRVGKTERLQT